MKMTNVWKLAGAGVLSVGVLAGCGSNQGGGAEQDYLTEEDVQQFYTEEELNTWAEENGLLDEEQQGTQSNSSNTEDSSQETQSSSSNTESSSQDNENAGADTEESDLGEEPSEEGNSGSNSQS